MYTINRFKKLGICLTVVSLQVDSNLVHHNSIIEWWRNIREQELLTALVSEDLLGKFAEQSAIKALRITVEAGDRAVEHLLTKREEYLMVLAASSL